LAEILVSASFFSPMKLRALFALPTLALVLCSGTQAALTWESTEADLHPGPSDTKAVAHYKYKNTGDKPIKITSVHPSCGCTTAALEKDVVAPNESGEIVATLNIGSRSGVQSKTITVQTDADSGQATVLKLRATIPRLLQVTPALIFWSKDDVLKPKDITVQVEGDYPVTKLDVSSTDKSIGTEVVRDPKAKQFRIVVTPEEAGRPIIATLKIQPDFPKDSTKVFFANVQVDSRAKMPPK